MSIPFRNVFVPKRGLTRVPYSSTTRPAAGHSNLPRIVPSPTPGVTSPGLGDGVVTREKNWQRPALDLQPVHRAEALGHGLLLPRAPALEARDVLLEIAHLGLRVPDPAVEQRHLPALVVQPPVYGLELGEDAGLALARV